MPVTQSRPMAGPYVSAALGAISLVFFVLAYVSVGYCGGGATLVYASLGILMIAIAVAAFGQVVPAFAGFILFLLLLVVGIFVTYGAGCVLF
jgi:hypothetical protein